MSNILDVQNLTVASVHFPDRPIVDAVSLRIARGEIVALVGESGSGKSVTALSLLGLQHPTLSIVQGSAMYAGRDLLKLAERAMRRLRGDRLAVILQDPTAALNPLLSVGTQIVETIRSERALSESVARRHAVEALTEVGVPAAEERLSAYPHHLSGGMRQRVAIAIALINAPDIVFADEPTTALDVTIQSQILAVVSSLVRRKGTALLWISHDLALVANLADRVYVMYAGQIVESGTVEQIVQRPRHPYTVGLIASIPDRSKRGTRLEQIPGIQPDPRSRPARGCHFADRCSRARPQCRLESPPLAGAGGQSFRCFFPHGN